MISFSSECLLLAVFSLSLTGVLSQYQPECHDLDSVITDLSSNLPGGTVPTCVKSADCTSLHCTFSLLGKELDMRVLLSPCSIPPQMTFILQDTSGQINVNTNITHQTTFPLPSDPFGLSTSSLRVDFQPVTEGVRFGLFLDTTAVGKTTTVPLVTDQVIRTPPCDTVPSNQPTRATDVSHPNPPRVIAVEAGNCTDMNNMLAQARIPSSFVCRSHQDCNGFQCNGTEAENDVLVDLRIDPCSVPYSFNITVKSNSLGLAETHNFTQSESFQILAGPAPVDLDVTMIPDPSTNTIMTTVIVKSCPKVLGIPVCLFQEKLLDNQPIPVPPCKPATTPSPPINIMTTANKPSLITVTPTPSNECTSWANIIHDMIQSAKGLGTLTCNVTANCTGIVCEDLVSGKGYIARLDLRHCVTPIELWMSIKSESDGDVDWQKTITHGESFVLPTSGLLNPSFKATLEKKDDTHVELGLDVKFSLLGASYTDTLIEDQLITVSQCNVEPTMKAFGLTTLAGNDKPNKVPIVEDGNSNNVGIVFGVLLAGMVVLCVIAGLLYVNRRRRYRRADETALIEDSFAEI
ncbi:uncharacterized protein [Antedon mediterranea]|uniref:uncharacterized protein isoform X2 n=1 Tax=Antedon mediterranea TaxID=105859 RepID=UPI003AF9957D